MHLTIKARLMACLAALAIGMVAIGLSGWISNAIAGKRIQSIIVDRVEPMQHLKAVSDMYAVNIVDSAHKARSGALDHAKALDNVKIAKAAITTNWEAYSATEMTDEERALLEKAAAALPEADKAVSELEGILASGDAAALDDFTAHKLYPAIDPVTAKVSALVDLQTTVAHRDGEEAAKAAKIAMMVMGAIALAAAGALAFATNIIIAKVSTPLQAMTQAMRGLADGDNAVAIPALGQRDELGQMAGAVSVFKEAAIAKIKADADLIEAKTRAERERLAASEAAIAEQQALVVQSFGTGLAKLAEGDLTYRVRDDLPEQYERLRGDFNDAMGKLRETMRGIVGNANSIRSGSFEITRASDDMARRTEQQAAGLEETAAAGRDHRHRQAHRRGGSAGPPGGRRRQDRRRKGRGSGHQGHRRHGPDRAVGPANHPDHRRDRRDRLPDQPAGPERRGRSGSGG